MSDKHEIVNEWQTPLVPARMVNEYAYCPRLAYLEWVQGEFRDSVDTLEGRYQHRNVDSEGGIEDVDRIHLRSVMVSSERLGAIARVDLVEGDGRVVTPVDYKKGEVPDVAFGAWEPERVQVCLQGLILRDNGYRTDNGVIYYVGSKKRVVVEFSRELVERTEQLVRDVRLMVGNDSMPEPLSESRKCIRCSLVGICLPDEVTFLEMEGKEVRRLYPARDDALPVYVQAQGMSIGKSGEVLVVKEKGKVVNEVRLLDVSQLNILGNVQISTQALRELLDRDIPVSYFSYGGRFYGITQGMGHKNIMVRREQFRVAEDKEKSLELAKGFVSAKIMNSRTLLRRNDKDIKKGVLNKLSALNAKAGRAKDSEELLGIEGAAAQEYFRGFSNMLKSDQAFFDFTKRNRRPPKDPVNALLSFAYSMLTKDMTVTLLSVGLDPYLGFYHVAKYGRPALALDLIEEFRPIIADSVVLMAVNNGEIKEKDFVSYAGAVSLTDQGRRKFIDVYERRMDDLVTHPVFGYRINYRRVLEVQARLLSRYLLGEISDYPAFRVR